MNVFCYLINAYADFTYCGLRTVSCHSGAVVWETFKAGAVRYGKCRKV